MRTETLPLGWGRVNRDHLMRSHHTKHALNTNAMVRNKSVLSYFVSRVGQSLNRRGYFDDQYYYLGPNRVLEAVLGSAIRLGPGLTGFAYGSAIRERIVVVGSRV
jgi:hypothetical protein